jgi:probable rRNA maturation factor
MIVNRQRAVRVPVHSLQEFFARALKEVRLAESAATVCFVTNAQIAKWNATYRGKNKPTDVLSFSVNGNPRIAPKNGKPSSISAIPYLGDIAIAPVIARNNARAYGRTLDEELRILILHGILHLMGYDHETDTGQMNRRELRLRRALGVA